MLLQLQYTLLPFWYRVRPNSHHQRPEDSRVVSSQTAEVDGNVLPYCHLPHTQAVSISDTDAPGKAAGVPAGERAQGDWEGERTGDRATIAARNAACGSVPAGMAPEEWQTWHAAAIEKWLGPEASGVTVS